MNSTRQDRSAGFTLIELMIVVAIIGILAAIALPSYRNYVLRGKIVDATNTLSAMRAKMEQFYQDNRTYSDSGSPCSQASGYNTANFHFSCSNVTRTTYTITAAGQDSMSDFAYTIDASGTTATTSLPTSWGSTSNSAWVTRPGGT